MSAFLILLGVVIFGGGAFGLFAGQIEKNALADSVCAFFGQVFSEPKTFLTAAGAVLAAIGVFLIVFGVVNADRSDKAENKNRAAMSIRVMTVLAMLIAMGIMLERFPGLSINNAGLKLGFAFIPPMLAAIMYGPVEGAIVYGLVDLIGALLFPFGTYHPGFTIVAAIMGFVMGVFLNKRPFAFAKSGFEWKKIRFFPNIILPVVINCLLLGLVVNTFWVSQLYGSRTYGGWFVYRLVEYAILVPAEIIMIPVLLKLCERLRKAGFGGR